MFELLSQVATTGFGSPADIWAAIVHDFSNLDQPGALAAFGQVLLIDLVGIGWR